MAGRWPMDVPTEHRVDVVRLVVHLPTGFRSEKRTEVKLSLIAPPPS
jgi:hypothetical protein